MTGNNYISFKSDEPEPGNTRIFFTTVSTDSGEKRLELGWDCRTAKEIDEVACHLKAEIDCTSAEAKKLVSA